MESQAKLNIGKNHLLSRIIYSVVIEYILFYYFKICFMHLLQHINFLPTHAVLNYDVEHRKHLLESRRLKLHPQIVALVIQSLSCVRLFCAPRDCSPLESSVHGIFQARILEQVASPSPGDLPDPGIEAGSPALQADSLPLCHQGSTSAKDISPNYKSILFPSSAPDLSCAQRIQQSFQGKNMTTVHAFLQVRRTTRELLAARELLPPPPGEAASSRQKSLEGDKVLTALSLFSKTFYSPASAFG